MPRYTSRREFANMVGRRAAELLTLTERVRESDDDPRHKAAVGALLVAVKQMKGAEAALRMEFDQPAPEPSPQADLLGGGK